MGVKIRILILVFILFFIIPSFAQNPSDHLILENIWSYTNSGKGRCGKGSGLIAAMGHFSIDHEDITCRTGYYNLQQDLAISVQVTQHAGSDSDRWLLHELDAEFRDYYGIPDLSFTVRNIDAHTVLVFSSGGRDYRWVSGNKVIMIEYTALEMSKKPEPIEIVKAYLAKHPSTLPPLTLQELRSPAHKTLWIKDEMERRVWLCEKWFLHLQMGKVNLEEALDAVVKSMAVFLDYREKYYGIRSKDEKLTLLTYLNQKDGTSLKQRLSTYKIWWAINKGKSITVP